MGLRLFTCSFIWGFLQTPPLVDPSSHSSLLEVRSCLGECDPGPISPFRTPSLRLIFLCHGLLALLFVAFLNTLCLWGPDACQSLSTLDQRLCTKWLLISWLWGDNMLLFLSVYESRSWVTQTHSWEVPALNPRASSGSSKLPSLLFSWTLDSGPLGTALLLQVGITKVTCYWISQPCVDVANFPIHVNSCCWYSIAAFPIRVVYMCMYKCIYIYT